MLDISRLKTANPIKMRQTLILLALACCVGILLGVTSILASPLAVLAGLLGVVFLIAVVRRPEIGLLAILIATSSIVFEGQLPLISIGVGSLHVPDVLLLGLLGLIIVRSLVEPEFKIVRTPLDLPLLAFYGIGLLSVFLGVLQSSVPGQEALRATRVFSYYLTFFVVTNLVRKRAQVVFLMDGLLLLGTMVAGAMIAQFLLGKSVTLFPGRIETLSTQGSTYSDVTRVLPPGQSLVLVAFVVLVVFLVLNKSWRLVIVRFLQAGVLGLAVILTFNRNFWVLVGFALFLLIFLMRGPDRQKLFVLTVAALLLGAMVLAPSLGDSTSRAKSLVTAAIERVTTLFSAETVQENSLQYRYLEYDYAIPQVLSHPLLGLGLGAQYRPWDKRLDWAEFDSRSYIHNGHLWIILTTGLLGYLCLMWLSILFLARGWRSWRDIADPYMKGTVLSFALIYIGVLVAAIVNPIYTQWHWTPVLGIMLGVNETLLRAGRDRSPT